MFRPFVLAALLTAASAAQETKLVPPGTTVPWTASIVDCALSRDGQRIAIVSWQAMPSLGDSNLVPDVYVRDQATQAYELVSVTPAGIAGNAGTFRCAISADGRFVVFLSYASDLVPGDTNGREDVFVRDTQAGTTTRVNVATDGSEADRPTDFAGSGRVISDDGRFVVFHSRATNLVPGDTNWDEDVFIRDIALGVTERVSVSSAGLGADTEALGGMLSADGSLVVFTSVAHNLVVPDANPYADVFLRDRTSGTTSLESLASDGSQILGWCTASAISADGRFVGIDTGAALDPADLDGLGTDAYLRDRQLGVTELVSPTAPELQPLEWLGDGVAGIHGLSDDARFVLIVGSTKWQVPGDTNDASDVFVRDRVQGVTTRVNLLWDGSQLGGGNETASLSGDGDVVAFECSLSEFASSQIGTGTVLLLRDSRAWRDIGHGAGFLGPSVPSLRGGGTLEPGELVRLDLDTTWSFGPAALIVGFQQLDVSFKGGVIVPSPDLVVPLASVYYGVSADAFMPDVPLSGLRLYAQVWIKDAWSVTGWRGTNAVEGVVP